MSDDRAAIERQMQIYFDGLYNSDTGRLTRVFHPAARYVCATSGAYTNLGMDEYFPIVDKREPPAARSESRMDSIASIMFAGPDAAVVRAYCLMGERRFSDLLTFIRDDGGWRIIAKVFHFDVIDPTEPRPME